MKKNLLGISLITLSCLYGMLVGVVILACIIAKVPITNALLISMIVLILQFLVAPALNDFVFKHLYKAKFDQKIPEYLERFIKESCEKHNMKYPRIGFIDDGTPNAFTYGRTKNDARVIFTRGILELLTEDEVKAVVAHELGHARHYDMLFMTVAQLVPLMLYYVAEILLRTNSKSSSSSNNNGNLLTLVGAIAYVLYIISQYIILWLSRTREYYADSFAIEETKNPNALGSALVKIGFGLAAGGKKENSKMPNGNALGINNANISKGMAISAYNNNNGEVTKESIINAMKWEQWNIWAKVNELNSTHPLISKRLLAISARSEEFGQEPYIVFNEKKTESYVDDFAIDVFIASTPSILTIAYLVLLFININSQFINTWLLTGLYGILLTASLFSLLNKKHKNSGYKETNVEELLSQVKVSNVTSIPCILEGKIIGRGNPGCIFNEDFVLQDDTGIIFLDYNQPLYALEKLFALFKSEEYFDKKVKIKGWYRRGAVPYVELYSMEIDGKVKKCHTYNVRKVFYWILLIASLACTIMSVM